MMPGPVPDRHLGTRCGRTIDKPGSHLGYPCTLPQGHDTRPKEDPEPHYVVEVPKSVMEWQAWWERQNSPDAGSSTRAAARMGDPDRQTSAMLAEVQDPGDLNDGSTIPVNPDGPHEHEYEEGKCRYCGNPGENWESATLSEGERAWAAGGPGPQPVVSADESAYGNPSNGFLGAVRKPEHWSALTGVKIMDADGWRNDSELGPKEWDVPIGWNEWVTRSMSSTVENPQMLGILREMDDDPDAVTAERREQERRQPPTKQREGDQKLPDGGQECVQDLIIAEMEASKAVGLERYGSTLMTFNGRKGFQDVAEEVRDLHVYLAMVQREAQATREVLVEVVAELLASDQVRDVSDDADAISALVVDRIMGWVIGQTPMGPAPDDVRSWFGVATTQTQIDQEQRNGAIETVRDYLEGKRAQ